MYCGGQSALPVSPAIGPTAALRLSDHDATAAPRSDAVEQGLQVAAFLFDRRPVVLTQVPPWRRYTIAIAWGSVACPVKAVRAWLEPSNITTGPLFRPIGKGSRIGTDRLADHTVVRWSRRALAASVLIRNSSPAIRSAPAS